MAAGITCLIHASELGSECTRQSRLAKLLEHAWRSVGTHCFALCGSQLPADLAYEARFAGQAEGIARAKKAGVYTGGKARIDRERVAALTAADNGPAAVARSLGVSRMSVYRIMSPSPLQLRANAADVVVQPLLRQVLCAATPLHAYEDG